MPGESLYSPRRLEAIEKQRRALELRMAGRTWQEIAKVVGYASHSGAIAAVNAALDRTLKEPSHRYRALTIERLTKVIASFWPAMLGGDEKAAGVILRTMEQLCAMLGLDAPVKQELSGPGGGPIELAAVTLEQKLRRIAEMDQQAALVGGIENGSEPD